MSLTKQHIDIISEHPLNDKLHPFREKLSDRDDDGNARQGDIADLVAALLLSTAAYHLPAPNGNGSVATRLHPIWQQADAGTVKPGRFRLLVDAVISNSPDTDIWEAVFHVIKALGPVTPPSSIIAATFKATPIVGNSNRLDDSEHVEIIERDLFHEIKNCTFRQVGSFHNKFFNLENWSKEQKAMLKRLMAAHNGTKWIDFPKVPDEAPVWNWFRSLEELALADAPHKLYNTTHANEFSEGKGQMDVFFQTRAAEGAFFYKNILVVGELKKSYNTSRFKADLLQLTRHVRSIFADQPTRRYVHAFTLCASMMELWVFDRSGPYSSGTFNIHEEPDKFARALIGYATMDNDAMGLDVFIERENEHRHVTLDDWSDGEIRVRLKTVMIRQKAVVSRGTTCYETKDRHVAKFSWVSDKRKREAELLRLAEKANVEGVARAIAKREVTTIAALRAGLQFPKAHTFRELQLDDSQSTLRSGSSGHHKRKSSSDLSDASGSKRQRSKSQKLKLATKVNDRRLSVSQSKSSLNTTNEDLWENRIFSCLVIAPTGRVIGEFKTVKELLESLRDAIRAHQNLHAANILHRDISSNNIIITDPEEACGYKGMLIDLDMAKLLDGSPSGARHATGTTQFMAVEVLRVVDHTYRHDLESFFYVLLWMCARESWHQDKGFAGQEKPPQKSRLRLWAVGSFDEIADAKGGHMNVNGLEDIMGEFPERLDSIKPLCLRIRSILFGDTARLSFGTPAGDPNQLYNPIIAAYNEAIDGLKE